jgi:hypothetical protein
MYGSNSGVDVQKLSTRESEGKLTSPSTSICRNSDFSEMGEALDYLGAGGAPTTP